MSTEGQRVQTTAQHDRLRSRYTTSVIQGLDGSEESSNWSVIDF